MVLQATIRAPPFKQFADCAREPVRLRLRKSETPLWINSISVAKNGRPQKTKGTFLLGLTNRCLRESDLFFCYQNLGTISVIELATMLPQAGGWYVYARRAFGDYGGFIVGWCDWLGNCAALALLATAIGEFSAILGLTFYGSVKAVAIITLLLFSLIHWLGLRLSSRTQELTSLVKALAFLALIVTFFVFGGKNSSTGIVRLTGRCNQAVHAA